MRFIVNEKWNNKQWASISETKKTFFFPPLKIKGNFIFAPFWAPKTSLPAQDREQRNHLRNFKIAFSFRNQSGRIFLLIHVKRGKWERLCLLLPSLLVHPPSAKHEAKKGFW